MNCILKLFDSCIHEYLMTPVFKPALWHPFMTPLYILPFDICIFHAVWLVLIQDVCCLYSYRCITLVFIQVFDTCVHTKGMKPVFTQVWDTCVHTKCMILVFIQVYNTFVQNLWYLCPYKMCDSWVHTKCITTCKMLVLIHGYDIINETCIPAKITI